MTYSFILKNEKTKNYRAISLLLVLFNLLGFVFLLMRNKESNSDYFWLIFSVVITAAYTFFALIKLFSKKQSPDFLHRLVFGLCAISWLFQGYSWLSILLVAIVLFDFLANRNLVVIIDEKKIKLPTLFQKEVEWNELNNLILKDDLLTIDFKNNKLFQQLILNSDSSVTEKEFNDFCKSRMTIDH